MTNAISIAIPTYEYNGNSKRYLKRLFRTIEKQSFKDFNICISDQSLNNDVVEVCNEFSDKLEINYHKNNDRSNPTRNINRSLEKADGDIVKVMFLDDFFYSNDALLIINDRLSRTDYKWAVCSSTHYNEEKKEIFRYMTPQWNYNLLDGINTIGSPTVIAYKKKYEKVFDESLRLLVDVEMYYRMERDNGLPLLIQETLVVNSTDENSTLGKMTKDMDLMNELLLSESKYCKKKLGCYDS